SDLWAASVMLWEALTGQRLFAAENDVALLKQVLEKRIPNPRDVAPELPPTLADLVMRGLERDPSKRVGSALEYATLLEEIAGFVNPREIGEWVRAAARDQLAARARRVADVESVATQPTGAPVGATIPPATSSRRAERGRAMRALAVLGTVAVVATW